MQTGDTIVELETDKINVEVPAQKAGVLTKRLKNEGDVVKVDEILGELDENATAGAATGSLKGADAGKETAPAQNPEKATSAQNSEKATPAPSGGSAASTAPASGSTAPSPAGATPPDDAATPASDAAATASPAKVAPAARRLAAEEQAGLSKVQGTGRGGTISKSDVIEQRGGGAGNAAPPAKAAPPAAGTETREKMTTRRKRIAEHLLQAKNATASLTTFNEVDMTALNHLRDKFKEKVEKDHGVKLTFMPFFVRAACLALKQYPVANATIDGDSIVYRHYVNMGIAVASEQGLVVPNLKGADRKGLLDISRDIGAVAKRARENKLTMDDLTGGTFTITNGGVFGSLVSTPILNYPQVAILGLHKIQDRPVAVDGAVVIRPMMYLALTYDHRIIDGQQAVLFLVRVKELIEEPGAMLIE